LIHGFGTLPTTPYLEGRGTNILYQVFTGYGDLINWSQIRNNLFAIAHANLFSANSPTGTNFNLKNNYR